MNLVNFGQNWLKYDMKICINFLGANLIVAIKRLKSVPVSLRKKIYGLSAKLGFLECHKKV